MSYMYTRFLKIIKSTGIIDEYMQFVNKLYKTKTVKNTHSYVYIYNYTRYATLHGEDPIS